MTVDLPEEEEDTEAGPSSWQMQADVTPKLDQKYFDKEMCYAPPKKIGKSRIELCKTLHLSWSHLCHRPLMREDRLWIPR